MVVYVVPFSILGFILACWVIYSLIPVLLIPLALLFPIGAALLMSFLMLMGLGGETKKGRRRSLIGVAATAALVVFIFINLERWLSRLPYRPYSLVPSDMVESGTYYAYCLGLVIGGTIYSVITLNLFAADFPAWAHWICVLLSVFIVVAVIVGIVQFLRYGPDYWPRYFKYVFLHKFQYALSRVKYIMDVLLDKLKYLLSNLKDFIKGIGRK